MAAFHSNLWMSVVVSWHVTMGAVPVDRSSSLPMDPLMLTPYVESGDVLEGQKAARNPSFFGDKESYSGYLTVNKETDTNLFFWYFKSETQPATAPVVLWLQGGPGASSMAGAFLENGPYRFTPNAKIAPRKFHWSERFHMLYIDNPAGAGFSFTEYYDYADDQMKIGKTLHEALSQFFLLFPELRRNAFYVAGESYAGKYVPAVAHAIHTRNLNATSYIPLKGIALGNAIIDPETQLNNGALYYELGIFDKETLRKYNNIVEEALKYIKGQSWTKATEMYYKLMDMVYNASGFQTLFNFVKDKNDIPMEELESFLDNYLAKKALHVGRRKFLIRSRLANMKLHHDRTQSAKSWFLEALENYDVLVYNGQLDLNKPFSGMVNFMSHLEWSGAAAYDKAPRNVWRLGGSVAGYSKTVWHRSKRTGREIKFSEVLVRNAGHLVPRDQPEWALAMMTDFVE